MKLDFRNTGLFATMIGGTSYLVNFKEEISLADRIKGQIYEKEIENLAGYMEEGRLYSIIDGHEGLVVVRTDLKMDTSDI